MKILFCVLFHVFLLLNFISPDNNYPQKVENWSTPVDCTQRKAWCYQFLSSIEINDHSEMESEDCLYINVFKPLKEPTDDLYPVLVWIHGGSYSSDSANKFPIEGTINNLVAENIIVIFINYRLGPLGFMSLGNSSLSGNVGLEDQIMALKWIQENVRNFNGDPNKITLAGESAGAACVSLLAISPKAKGLFHQTIIRSGSSLAPWAVNNEYTVENTKFLLNELGCLSEDKMEIFSCLQNSSFEEIKEIIVWIMVNLNKDRALFPLFTPVVDNFRGVVNSVLPDNPNVLLKTNANLPTMAGMTDAESLYHMHVLCKNWILLNNVVWINENNEPIVDLSLGLFPYLRNSPSLDWQFLFPKKLFNNSDSIYKSIGQKYFTKNEIPSNRTKLFAIITQVLSDYYIASPLTKEMDYYLKNNATVYFYRFAYTNDFLTSLFQACPQAEDYKTGSVHGTDVAMLFLSTAVLRLETEFSDFTLNDLAISKLLSNHVVSFVKFGNPNGISLETKDDNVTPWSIYQAENKKEYFIDSYGSSMKSVDNSDEFWFGNL